MGLSYGARSRSRTITSSRARWVSPPTGMSSLPTRSRCSRMASVPLVASVPSEDVVNLSLRSGSTCRSRSLPAYATNATWPTTSMSMWSESADWEVRAAPGRARPQAREMSSPARCHLPPDAISRLMPSFACAISREMPSPAYRLSSASMTVPSPPPLVHPLVPPPSITVRCRVRRHPRRRAVGFRPLRT